MNDALSRSIDAAARLLEAHSRGAPLQSEQVELASWLVGAGGGTPPRLADRTADLEARLAALLGAGDQAGAKAFLLEHVPTKPGERLLGSACMLAGDAMADMIVELTERLRTGWFLGWMLTRTTRPDRLLALLGADQRHRVRTLAELVIAGRDKGTPIAEAETAWAAIAKEPHWNWSYMEEYCNAAVRIKVREDLETAVGLLETFERPDRPGHVFEGVFAVLARLVRQDPSRAATLTADAVSPQDRAIRLQGLTWWFELPSVAEPIANEMLGGRDPYVELSLVRILAVCRTPALLQRALAGAAGEPPLEIADHLALGVHALRVAGRHDDAERVRGELLPVLAAQPIAPTQVAPRDLFDVISAPGRPPMTPWRTPPGLPHPCP
jgi:hypothetical protein